MQWMTSLVMTLEMGVEAGSSCAVTMRVRMSRSVMMPAMLLKVSVTMSDPMWCSFMSLAASRAVEACGMVWTRSMRCVA